MFFFSQAICNFFSPLHRATPPQRITTRAAWRQLASTAPSSSESSATHSEGTAGAGRAAASKHWGLSPAAPGWHGPTQTGKTVGRNFYFKIENWWMIYGWIYGWIFHIFWGCETLSCICLKRCGEITAAMRVIVYMFVFSICICLRGTYGWSTND